MRRLSVLLAAAMALLAGVSVDPAGAVGEAVVPGDLRVDATFEHLGVVWFVGGDTDGDSQMTLEFRPAGDTRWRPAAPAMRATPGLTVDGARLGLDAWGASAMFLTPAMSYEVRATLTDPDGGGTTRTVTASTRAPLTPAGRVRQVVPGSGGGTGTAADPFRGLAAAAAAARPGDTFQVGPGTYGPFEITTSGTPGNPVSFIGPPDGSAVVDGAGTDRGVVTIGTFDRVTSHVIVDGLAIRNGRWGVDAQNTQDIAVSRSVISDVDFGIVNRRGNDWERNQTVCDNRITGRAPWPGTGIPSERGIDLRGWGNVVCHNQVRFFGDCVSVQPSTGPSYGNDLYGNDASFCVDDGIEIDYNQANVRVFRNRVMNSRMGVSVQPIRGGPAYIFRNELFNLESNTIKLNNAPAGLYVAHNTGVMNGNGLSDASEWKNAVFRNNLFVGTRYAFEFTTVSSEGFRDFDYNAWGTTRTVGPGGPWFKWNNVRYDRIGDLPSGVEEHGVEVALGDLVSAELPVSWDVAVTPGTRDLRPIGGAPAVDAGADLPNLNDGLTLSGRPDMGAFELGVPLPGYGPRAAADTRFVDVAASHLFFADIEWLAAQGVTRGCTADGSRFCPDQPVTRGQMAAFLARALALPAPGPVDTFTDDDASLFQTDIEKLAAAGITRGCTADGSRFCPEDPVTRGQMAAFLHRALG